MHEMKTGVELIAEERRRQVEKEGYTAEHDANHGIRDFTSAAKSYLSSASLSILSNKYPKDDSWHQYNEPCYRRHIRLGYPWGENSFKPTTPLRDLVKAGALIAAAIDRLQAQKEF